LSLFILKNMSKKKIATIIDLGTYKCTTIITMLNEDNLPRVIGMGVAPTLGVKRSNIIALEQARESIEKSVESAEAVAGINIDEAVVLISGANVVSQNSQGMVSITSQSQEIDEDDIDRVRYNTKSIKIPSDKTLIHLVDQSFKVDDQDGIENPIGMTGMRLELKAHLVMTSQAKLHHLETCLKGSDIGVSQFVFSALGASEVALTDTEKELGSLLIDIGAGTTNFCMFYDSSLQFSGSIPIGARNFTTDLTQFYNINIEDAEKIKLYVSNNKKLKFLEEDEDQKKRRRKNYPIDFSEAMLSEKVDFIFEDVLLNKIFYPRMEEIFKMVADKLKEKKLYSKISGGVVLTGGGAKVKGSVEVAKKVFKTSARIGRVKDGSLSNIDDNLRDPQYAAIIGGLTYHLNNKEIINEEEGQLLNNFGGFWEKIKGFFKNIAN
jgi:cell division protein FtsA